MQDKLDFQTKRREEEVKQEFYNQLQLEDLSDEAETENTWTSIKDKFLTAAKEILGHKKERKKTGFLKKHGARQKRGMNLKTKFTMLNILPKRALQEVNMPQMTKQSKSVQEKIRENTLIIWLKKLKEPLTLVI